MSSCKVCWGLLPKVEGESILLVCEECLETDTPEAIRAKAVLKKYPHTKVYKASRVPEDSA